MSRTHFDRENSALGKVGGIMGVTEPQSDSRLHLHLLTYPSTMSPDLLSRVIPSELLSSKARSWIDRTSTTSLDERTHDWLDKLKGNNEKIPRSSEIPVAFVEIADADRECKTEFELKCLMEDILLTSNFC